MTNILSMRISLPHMVSWMLLRHISIFFQPLTRLLSFLALVSNWQPRSRLLRLLLPESLLQPIEHHPDYHQLDISLKLHRFQTRPTLTATSTKILLHEQLPQCLLSHSLPQRTPTNPRDSCPRSDTNHSLSLDTSRNLSLDTNLPLCPDTSRPPNLDILTPLVLHQWVVLLETRPHRHHLLRNLRTWRTGTMFQW